MVAPNSAYKIEPLSTRILIHYYGFRHYDPGTSRWPNRDPFGELGHQLLQYDYEEDAFYSEISREITLLRVEITNRYSRLLRKQVGTLEEYEEAIAEEDAIYELFFDLLYLAELNRKDYELAEFLPEGPSLYAFIGNSPLDYFDVLGERGGKSRPGDDPKFKDPNNKTGQKFRDEANKRKRDNKHRRPPKKKKPKVPKCKPKFRLRLGPPIFIPNWLIPGTPGWDHMHGGGGGIA